jgi:hypothetical protein
VRKVEATAHCADDRGNFEASANESKRQVLNQPIQREGYFHVIFEPGTDRHVKENIWR